jgi:hypothetical protein
MTCAAIAAEGALSCRGSRESRMAILVKSSMHFCNAGFAAGVFQIMQSTE